MALTKLTADVQNIHPLPNQPNKGGMTAQQLKDLFDKAGVDIKAYLNNTLTAELDALLSALPAVGVEVDPITGLVTTGNDLQSVLEALHGESSGSNLPADSVDTIQIVNGAVEHAKLDDDAVEANNIKDGEVADGKLGENSVNASNIKLGAVSTTYTATIPAKKTVENEQVSAWEYTGPPFMQEIEATGLVPEDPDDPTTTVTWTCNSADQDVLDAYALLTLAADTDAVLVSTDDVITVDIPIIATQNSVPYSVTIDADDYIPTGAPVVQEVTVAGLLAADAPIVDLVPSTVMATAEAQLEAYGVMFKMVAENGKLVVYATEKTEADVTVQIKAVRK